jgi:hypothetical protein
MLSGAGWSLGLLDACSSQPPFSVSSSVESSLEEGDGLFGYGPPAAASAAGREHHHAAVICGPTWHVSLGREDFSAYVHMLGQLRMAVSSLRYQQLWNAGSRERPPSCARVRLTAWGRGGMRLDALTVDGCRGCRRWPDPSARPPARLPACLPALGCCCACHAHPRMCSGTARASA